MDRRNIALAATALTVAWCGNARADETSEKALAEKLEDLQRRFEELSRRVGDGTNGAGDELEQRVAELEKLSKKDKDGLFPYWGNGIRMDSPSGAFKLAIGGRIQSDWTWFANRSDAERAVGKEIEAGEEFRRARLMVGGQIYDNVQFSAEYDFAGGAPAPRDVWVMLKSASVGNFQVGNIKEPTGTEELTSDLFIPFLERSAGNEAFAPDYKAGFMWSRNFAGTDGSVQAGVFRNSASNGNDVNNNRSGEYDYTLRVAGRPWHDEEGSQYLTAGLALSERTPSDDSLQFKAHPELHIAPTFADTGAFDATSERFLEVDAGFVSGPFWVFADWFDVGANRDAASDVTFHAWSLSAGWFLTGEGRPFKSANSTYDRVKPRHDFDGKGGSGAWEVAARVDSLDLDDGDLRGGKVDTYTVGLSWYANPNTRVMLDWVHLKQKDLKVSVDGVEVRVQLDF